MDPEEKAIEKITEETSYEDGSSAATAISGTSVTRASNTGIKLLDLTPVCLQNTDNILNTLIFMCLDQGHDFRDESQRTMVANNTRRGWVNIEVNQDCYLNKISQDEMSQILPEAGEKCLDAEILFGKHEFMRGLLKTTFAESNGAFGFVLMEDEEWRKLGFKDNDDDTALNMIISQKIFENIEISLLISQGSYYYITSGTRGGNKDIYGTKLDISHNGGNAEILFLNFYKRCFNDGMHKLWDFTTKKHLYMISLNKICINKSGTGITIVKDKTEFECKKITEIDLIVPQYRLNLSTDLIAEPKSSKSKGPLYISDTASEEEILQVSRKFGQALFTGAIDGSPVAPLGTDDKTSRVFDAINYIPRGTRFWFDTAGSKVFKNLVKILYKYQTPLIHTDYKISNDIKIEQAKRGIFSKLLPDTKTETPLFNKYFDIKSNPQSYSEIDTDFILKQYGIITDTSIGSNKHQTTADYLISSLNNLKQDIDCRSLYKRPIEEEYKTSKRKRKGGYTIDGFHGGAGEFEIVRPYLNTSTQRSLNEIIRNKSFNMTIGAIDIVLKYLYNSELENKYQLIDTFMQGVKEKFNTNISDIDKKYNKIKSPLVPTAPAPAVAPQRLATDETGRTTLETISATSQVSPPTIQTTITPVTPTPVTPTKIEAFNNIDNVKEVFELNDTILLETPFVKINSTTPNLNIDNYIRDYSNNLQLYYDYIPQQTITPPDNNYFNNCWQSIDFFQEIQTGGAYYPFKFTVTSGQLDSSKLGGQSIPQYHPPEIDIYMTIFDQNTLKKSEETARLTAPTIEKVEDKPISSFKGIIARMVVVKEVLNNAINVKSQVVVFCHFVYVDFERTEIEPPKDYSEYSKKIKELLDYTVDHTYYVNNESCVDLNDLESTIINSDENIDFELRFDHNKDIIDPFITKWYKYYSYTYGPPVEKGIVYPTDGNSLTWIRAKASDMGYVVSGIVNVAEKLIRNSSKLRSAFGITEGLSDVVLDINPGMVLFVKLFLIRNKYTGDKSRATDTLFLNQTKYLEGIQVSNDENTLYNAMMFGQNIIWSTSSKTVFNMAPYLTKNGKMPITSGFFFNELCKGLRQNQFIDYGKTGDTSKPGKGSADDDEDNNLRIDIRDEIMTQIDGSLLEDIKKCIGQSFMNTPTSFIEKLVEGIFELNKLKKLFDDYKNYYSSSFDTELTQTIKTAKDDGLTTDRLTDGPMKTACNSNGINGLPDEIKSKFDEIKELADSLKTTYTAVFNSLKIAIITLNKCKPPISIDKLFKLILYISKNFTWWDTIQKIIDNIDDISNKYYCILSLKYILALKNLNEEITNETTKTSFEKIISNRWRDFKPADNPCFPETVDGVNEQVINTLKTELSSITDPISSDNSLLKQLDSQSTPDEIKYNNAQFDEAVLFLINSIKNAVLNDSNLENYDTILQRAKDESIKIAQYQKSQTEKASYIDRIAEDIKYISGFIAPAPTGTRVTERLSGGAYGALETIPQYSLTKMNDGYNADNYAKGLVSVQQKVKPTEPILQEDTSDKTLPISNTDTETKTSINKEELIEFYKNSYKNNILTYLQGYITIIKNIDMKYQDKQINFNTNTVQEILIKILLLKIDDINNSYIPAITSKSIIEKLQSINSSLSVENLNTILNYYSQQLSLYSIINIIINSNYNDDDNIELLQKLINENTSDYDYKHLNLTFTKRRLLDKLLTQSNNDNEQNANIETSNPQSLIQSNTVGGVSVKNKRDIKNHKTRNNKRKNKNQTIKKKNNKIKRNTRRH
jgi:hypothetical protein